MVKSGKAYKRAQNAERKRLEMIERKKFFASCPRPSDVPEGGGVKFPGWILHVSHKPEVVLNKDKYAEWWNYQIKWFTLQNQKNGTKQT